MFGRRKKPDTGSPPVGGSSGFGAPYGVHYSRHAQPDPGIAAFSYDTLALPLYTPIGWGVQNRRQFREAPSNPVVYQLQGIAVTTIGSPGNLAGQFVSTPLIDTQSNPGALQIAAVPSPGAFEMPRDAGY